LQLPARSAGDRTGSGLQATEDKQLNWDLDPRLFRVQGLGSHEAMRRAMDVSAQDTLVWVDPTWTKDFPEKTAPDVDTTAARIPEQASTGHIHRSWHLQATPSTSLRILKLREGMCFLAPEWRMKKLHFPSWNRLPKHEKDRWRALSVGLGALLRHTIAWPNRPATVSCGGTRRVREVIAHVLGRNGREPDVGPKLGRGTAQYPTRWPRHP
jgi:hypothetical protein